MITTSEGPLYFVTTVTGNRIGPFDDWGCAWWSGVENFGFEGWEITHT